MSLAADALQPYLVKEFVSLSGRAKTATLTDLIVADTIGYNLAFDDNDQSITIDFRDQEPVIDALAGDCCRFSFASFQTVSRLSVETEERDTVAWSLVKAYYAAFYAAHALIRLTGESCSFFDRQHTARIVQLGNAYGLQRSFGIDSGLYHCVLSPNATALKCIRIRSSVGIHEAFWNVFGAKIDSLAQAVLAGNLPTIDAQTTFAQLEKLTNILARRGGFSWLSNVRNDLQYRQHHGVWFPARLKKSEKQSLGRIIARWSDDPMTIDLDTIRFGLLGDFMAACTFIVALCHALLDRIAERSTAGVKSFVCLGPITYLNDIAA